MWLNGGVFWVMLGKRINLKFLTFVLISLFVLGSLGFLSAGCCNCDPDESMNEAVDISGFSSTSKILYEDMFFLNMTVNSENAIPSDYHSMGDIVNFFNTHKISAVAVKTTKENLKAGDIVQIKGYDPAFRIYIGHDEEGNVILADMDDRYICTSEAFDSLFTGNTVCVKHQPTTNTTIINGYTVNDQPLKKDESHERFEGQQEDLVNAFWRGTSTKNAIGTYYWRDNQTMRQLAKIILNSVPGRNRASPKSKAWGIWSWMKLNESYGPRHMYFHCTGPRDPLAPWGCTEHTRDIVHWNTIHSFQQTYDAKHETVLNKPDLLWD